MKIAAICVACAFELATAGVRAEGPGDQFDKVRACSVLERADRLECLQRLSRDIGPPPPRAVVTPTPDWIVSETTSPIDYTPVAVATASSGGKDGGLLQLSIQCRGGRTEMVIGGPAITRRAEDYVVSYGINDTPPVGAAVGPPASGTGVALKGDVVRLLASLPDQGEIAFRLAVRQGDVLEGRYALASLKSLRDRRRRVTDSER
jgi:hypothetical protein